MARKKHARPEGDELISLSRNDAGEYYSDKLRTRTRKRVIQSLLASILVVFTTAAVAAAAYVSDINQKITGSVDANLKSALATQEPGKPFYMLLIGVDKANWRSDLYGTEDSGYRSDTMIVARIDPSEKKVTLVSIHRDTMIDLSPYGYGTQEKINSIYSYGQETLTTKVISDFAGVSFSHYAEVNMDGLWDIVDSIGGIDVNVPFDIDDSYTNLHLKKGKQHLNGHDTVRYCRCRHAYDALGDGDRYRANVQRQVIGIIAKKVLSSDPATMAKTISTAAGYIRTDMDVQSILTLATQFAGMDFENNFYTGMEPTAAKYINATWFELVDPVAWRKMMDRVDQGLPPTEEGDVDALETSPDTFSDLAEDSYTSQTSYSNYYYTEGDADYDDGGGGYAEPSNQDTQSYDEPTYVEPASDTTNGERTRDTGSGSKATQDTSDTQQETSQDDSADEEATYEEPVVEEVTVEKPVAEESVAEEATVETPVAEEATVEEPVAEESVADTSTNSGENSEASSGEGSSEEG